MRKRITSKKLFEIVSKIEPPKQPPIIVANPSLIRLHEITSRMENNLELALKRLR